MFVGIALGMVLVSYLETKLSFMKLKESAWMR
jgi:hypothetical protein